MELFWPVSALSCHRLDLTERSQTQLKCGKTISYLTRLFFTTPKPAIVAQIHAFHVALSCFSECDDFTCLSTGACIIIWQRFCCCLLNLKQTEKEAFQLFTFHNFTRSEPTHMKSGPRYPTKSTFTGWGSTITSSDTTIPLHGSQAALHPLHFAKRIS